jgi:hypothetical protein
MNFGFSFLCFFLSAKANFHGLQEHISKYSMSVEYALDFKNQILIDTVEYFPDWWLWSSDPKPWIF